MTYIPKTWMQANLGGGGASGVSSFNSRTGAVSLTSGDVTGALTFTPQPAGSYLTGNQTITFSGDASGSGATSVSLTLATVNSNTGTYGGQATVPQISVDGKGRVTSVSAVGIQAPWAGLTGVPAAVTALSGTNTGDQTSVTGNAGTATKLATPRNINGVAFDGSANITINAVDSTARLAASAVSAFGLTLIDDPDADTARATLGAQAAGNYATGGGTATGTNTGDQFTNMTSSRLLGRYSAGFGAAQEISLGSGLSFDTGTGTLILDADLAALAGVSGTNTLYYRSAAGTWSAVTIGANLSFSGGTLSATAGGGAGGGLTVGQGQVLSIGAVMI